MTLYSQKVYRSFTYGATSKTLKNVGNFTATAVNYSRVDLSWSNVLGGYTALRLVRNQEGFSETSEDGIILYEEFDIDSSTGSASKSFFADVNTSISILGGVEETKSAPELIPGQPVFYTIWWLVNGVWTTSGFVFVILPKQHYEKLANSRFTVNSHEKFLNLLPKIYTSKSNGPLDEIAVPEYDQNGSLISQGSDLYFFTKGLSVSLDETLTYIDFLVPDYSGKKTIPSLVSRKISELGFSNSGSLALQRQNDLIKNAIYIYSKKGTIAGLVELVKSITGLPTFINNSPNLMLSLDDSSFKTTVGNWTGGSITKTAYSTLSFAPPSEGYAIEVTNCAQITGSATVSNGVVSPIYNGIPVSRGAKYTFSFYARKSATSGTALPRVKFYDYQGSLISAKTVVASSASSIGNTAWTKVSLDFVVPGYSVPVVFAALFSNVATLTVNGTHNFTVGSSITVQNVSSVFNGTYTVTAVSGRNISYSKTNANVLAYEVSPTSGAIITDGSDDLGLYAGLEIDFGSGTYYLDNVQVANSTITQFYEPRGVEVFLAPRKSNYISNPSFEVNGTGWSFTPSGSSQTVTVPSKVLAGTKVYQVTTTSGSAFSGSFTLPRSKVSTGKNYVFSIWAKTNNSSALNYSISLSANLNIKIYSRNITFQVASLIVDNPAAIFIGDTISVSGLPTSYNGTFTVTGITGTTISYAVPGASNEAWTDVLTDQYVVKTISRTIDVQLKNVWSRPEVSLFIPETWDYFFTTVTCSLKTKTTAGGEIVYVDAAQLEEGVFASDYFDGSYSWEYGADWATANASPSYLYPNKVKMIDVLKQELPKFLPYETPWVISTTNLIEAKGITQ